MDIDSRFRLSAFILIGTALVAMGCTSDGVRAQDSDQHLQEVVHDALTAKLTGFGGCLTPLDSVQELTLPEFPSLRFWLGECVLEHGTLGQEIVATEASGVLHFLDSESGFRFLVARNSPAPEALADQLAYGALALRLIGAAEWSSEIIHAADELPIEIREALGDGARQAFSRMRPDATRTAGPGWITMLSGRQLVRFFVIFQESGAVSAVGTGDVLWDDVPVH